MIFTEKKKRSLDFFFCMNIQAGPAFSTSFFFFVTKFAHVGAGRLCVVGRNADAVVASLRYKLNVLILQILGINVYYSSHLI
jgi:hypothetical protein